jgi:hypothetical protein
MKRYEGMVHSSGGDYWVEMEESRNGEYVKFEDYKALEARCNEEESNLASTLQILASERRINVKLVENQLELKKEIEAVSARIPEWHCSACNTVRPLPDRIGFNLTCPCGNGTLLPSTQAERSLREECKILRDYMMGFDKCYLALNPEAQDEIHPVRLMELIENIITDRDKYKIWYEIAEPKVIAFSDECDRLHAQLLHEREELRKTRDCLLNERNVIEALREKLESAQGQKPIGYMSKDQLSRMQNDEMNCYSIYQCKHEPWVVIPIYAGVPVPEQKVFSPNDADKILDERHLAPWPDFNGAEIREGDIIAHPDGTRGIVHYFEGLTECWQVQYEDSYGRLSLHVGFNKDNKPIIMPSGNVFIIESLLTGDGVALKPLNGWPSELNTMHMTPCFSVAALQFGFTETVDKNQLSDAQIKRLTAWLTSIAIRDDDNAPIITLPVLLERLPKFLSGL